MRHGYKPSPRTRSPDQRDRRTDPALPQSRTSKGPETPSELARPAGFEPRDPLLRRHIRTVAGRRLASLYEPSASRYCSWLSEDVARRRPPLAPLLAPQNLLAFANVRVVENITDYVSLRRAACEPSHPSRNAVSSTAAGEPARPAQCVSDRSPSSVARLTPEWMLCAEASVLFRRCRGGFPVRLDRGVSW
jgi:hypothetical protein